MSTGLQFSHSPVGEASQGPEQPDPAALSVEEIRNCFPGRITLAVNGERALSLDDAPLLGVLVELSELWERVQQGATTAEVVDFYGEYKLVMRLREGIVELQSAFSGGRVSAPRDAFVAAARVWADALLQETERLHPGLTQNPNYRKLESFVEGTWTS